MAKALRHAAFARIALLSAVLAGIVLAFVLAGSPSLHVLVHPDAGDSEHSCLVTTIHGNGWEAAPIGAQVAIFGPALSVAAAICEVQEVEALFLRCRVLEHAPPFIS